MVRFLALFLSLVLLSACVTTQNMKVGEALMANEGIVVTTCQTPNAINRLVDIIPENYRHSFGDIPPNVECNQEGKLAVIKLEAGSYHTGNTNDFNKYKHLPKFTVQANKINYIGDLRIAVRETNVATGLLIGFEQPQINFSVLDKRQETLQRLKDERSDIAEKYDVVVNIAE